MPTLAELPAPPQPAPQEAAPAAAPSLPSPFGDVMAGVVPAVSIPPLSKDSEPDPAQSFVIQNMPALTEAGLDLYEASDLSTVVFNPQKISEADLKTADESGKLAEIAPSTTPAAPPEAPAAAEAAPAAPAAGLAALPPPGRAVPPRVARAQLQNLNPRKASPIVPNPVPDKLARRAV